MQKTEYTRTTTVLDDETNTRQLGQAPPCWDQGKIKSIPAAQVLETLQVTEEGLSSSEALNRLQCWGPNALEEHKTSPIKKFLSFFWGPIPWMIEAAAALSGAVLDWDDFIIIMIMLLLNAIIGFWQEFKADNAIALLKEKLALSANVKRDGNWQILPARDLVPGDIIRVKLGNIIPADVKLLSAENVETDQSALTGESLPVHKEHGDEIYMSSIIRKGLAIGVVTGTGTNTMFGRTAALVQEADSISHYQQAIMKIGRFLIGTTLILVGLILVVAMFRGTPMLETLKFCLILTVAAIPVALPAVLSVTMAVGAEKLAKQGAVVSRLVSIEELAGMDVLCSDKTGTLTQNRMVLGNSVLIGNIAEIDLIHYAALASNVEDHDPLEEPIFNALKNGMQELAPWKVVSFHPFDPVSKRTEASVLGPEGPFRVSKGAPQAILKLDGIVPGTEQRVKQAVEDLGKKGYRTIGVARNTGANPWEYLGLLSFYDPPRIDCAETIEEAQKMGVRIKMLTGDHQAIACETARSLNLCHNIITAEEAFDGDKTWDKSKIDQADGFAQVYPEHKFAIVKALQDLDHYVGMTGDGVNDAPALKEAHVGVAVSGATDAARDAADLVLTQPGLKVIVKAIEESRRIFRRMSSYGVYRIAETIRILIFMTLSILVFDFYPVTTVMVIILALLNDGPILMIAYDNTDLPMAPTRWDMRKILIQAVVLGVLGVCSSFLLFAICESLPVPPSRDVIQTLMFLKLTVAGHMTIYLTRTREHNFWHKPFPSKMLFWVCEITQVFATLMAVYGFIMTPIGWELAGIVWAYAFGWFLLNNFVKVRVARGLKK